MSLIGIIASSKFVVPPISVGYLVVAGGGGGGQFWAGGGGGGGLRSTVTATGGGGTLETALNITKGINYTITVGGGGGTQTKGSDSVFATITSEGGGNGRNFNTGVAGGSGGGGQYITNAAGGAGTPNQAEMVAQLLVRKEQQAVVAVVQDKQGEMLSLLIMQVMAETELQLLLLEVLSLALAAVEVLLVQIPQEVQVRVAQVVAVLEQKILPMQLLAQQIQVAAEVVRLKATAVLVALAL
jgi:hypothetical protein